MFRGARIFQTFGRHSPTKIPQSHHLKLANLARLLHAKSKLTQHLVLILLPRQKKESSDIGAKAHGELSKKASIDGMESRSMLKKLSGCIPQGEEVSGPRPPDLCGLKHRYPKGGTVRASAEASASLFSLHQGFRRNVSYEDLSTQAFPPRSGRAISFQLPVFSG